MHDGTPPLDTSPPEAEERRLLEEAFIAGFRLAADKQAFLALSGIPWTLSSRDGARLLKLVEVRIEEGFVVGAASPGFGGGEWVHHPLPESLIRKASRLSFIYVSADEWRAVSLAELRGRVELPTAPL